MFKHVHKPSKIFIIISIVFGTVLLCVNLYRPHIEGDTVSLRYGASIFWGCLKAGNWTRCDMGPYPIFQYPFAMLFDALTHRDKSFYRLFTLMNGLAFISMMMILLKEEKSQKISFTVILLLMTSPLTYYCRTTFNEPVATFFLLFFVCELANFRRFWVVLALSFLNCICKETMVPFVPVLGVGTLLLTGDLKTVKKLFISILLGTCFGFALNSGFNYFKTGTLHNAGYINIPDFATRDTETIASNFFGHFFSPSAGIILFWPLAALIIGWSHYYFFIFGKRFNPQRKIGLLLIFSVFWGQIVGTSLWWAPFGWLAYGDRLLYPILPAICYVLLWQFQAVMWPTFVNLPKAVKVAIGTTITLSTLTHLTFVIQNLALEDFFFRTIPDRPNVTIQQSPDLFRSLLRHQTWVQKSILIEHWERLLSSFEWINVFAIIFGIFLTTLMLIDFYQLRKITN